MKISSRKGRYGIDAPYAPAGMLAGAAGCVALIVFAVRLLRPVRRESVHGDGDAPGSNRDATGDRHIGR